MKTWKNLIIPAGLLVLLVCLLFSYQYWGRNAGDAGDASETSYADRVLISYDEADISSVHVDRSDGTEFTVSSAGNGIWDYASNHESTGGYALSQMNLAGFILSQAYCVVSEPLNEEGQDLSEYGLDQPSASVTYTMTSGAVHTMLYGNLSPDEGEVYCMFDSSGIVYTAEALKLAKCRSTLLDFLDTDITDLDAGDTESITFTRTEDDTVIIASPRTSSSDTGSALETKWKCSQPQSAESTLVFDSLIKSFMHITADSFAEFEPDDLSGYGLDDPAYTFVAVLLDNSRVEVKLSRDMGGIYYGISSSSPAVFRIKTSAITGLQTPPGELAGTDVSSETTIIAG